MWVDGAQPHGSEPPLGELLLARGLISREQLDQALSIQTGTHRPLGQVLVELGFVTGPTIAQALATQHGRIFKSEHGFATGFDAALEVPEGELPPVTARSGNTLTLVPPPVNPAKPASEQRGEEPIPSTSDETRQRARLPTPLTPHADLGGEPRAADERLDELAAQLASAAERMVDAEIARDAALKEAETRAATVAELEAERTGLARRVETLEDERTVAAQHLAEAKEQLADALRERDQARTAAAGYKQAAVDDRQALADFNADRVALISRIRALEDQQREQGQLKQDHDDETQRQLAETNKQLASTLATLDTSRETIIQLQSATADAERLTVALESDRMRLTERLGALEHHSANAEQQQRETEARLAIAVTERNKAYDTIAELEQRVAEGHESAARLQGESERLAQRIQALEHDQRSDDAQRQIFRRSSEQQPSTRRPQLEQKLDDHEVSHHGPGDDERTLNEREAAAAPVEAAPLTEPSTRAESEKVDTSEPTVERSRQHVLETLSPELSHLLLFATPKGYALLERSGPCPTPGETIDLSFHGGSPAARVNKLEQRTYRGWLRRCACLI